MMILSCYRRVVSLLMMPEGTILNNPGSDRHRRVDDLIACNLLFSCIWAPDRVRDLENVGEPSPEAGAQKAGSVQSRHEQPQSKAVQICNNCNNNNNNSNKVTENNNNILK